MILKVSLPTTLREKDYTDFIELKDTIKKTKWRFLIEKNNGNVTYYLTNEPLKEAREGILLWE